MYYVLTIKSVGRVTFNVESTAVVCKYWLNFAPALQSVNTSIQQQEQAVPNTLLCIVYLYMY